MESGFKKTLCNLFGITARSYSNWAKEDRAIISLFEKNYLSKSDIEEYLNNNQITKLELIKNYTIEELEEKLSTTNAYTKDERIKEIILLLTRYSDTELSQELRYCLGIVGLNNTKQYTKIMFIEKVRNILKDASNIDELYDNEFHPLIESLNNKLGFDFSINDIDSLTHLISRYKVYNTLYQIDKI